MTYDIVVARIEPYLHITLLNGNNHFTVTHSCNVEPNPLAAKYRAIMFAFDRLDIQWREAVRVMKAMHQMEEALS